VVHETNGIYSKPLKKIITLLRRLAAKISHINHDKHTFDHLVLRKEWNNTIERPQKRFAENKGQ